MPIVAQTGAATLTIDDFWYQNPNQTWSGSYQQPNRARALTRRRDWAWPSRLTTDQTALWIDYGTGPHYSAGPQTITGTWYDTNATANSEMLRLPRQWIQAYTGTQNQQVMTIAGATLWDVTAGTLWQDGIQQSPEATERYRREQAKTKLQRARASKRGRKLLLSLLDLNQQRQYAETQTFTVIASDGLIYRLRKSKTAELVGPDGGSVANYCIHLSGSFCPEDNLIAQKFLLETNVPEFERIANITVIRDRLYKKLKTAAQRPALLRAA